MVDKVAVAVAAAGGAMAALSTAEILGPPDGWIAFVLSLPVYLGVFVLLFTAWVFIIGSLVDAAPVLR